MPKHLLSARQVQTARVDLADGDRLTLRVEGKNACWTLRYTSPNGRRREFGLGAADRGSLEAAGASLTRARKRAEEVRGLLDSGRDPIEEKQAKRRQARQAEAHSRAEAERERATLARVARAYHERVVEPRRTPIHAREWISSLERHIPEGLWHKPIDQIEAPELLNAVAKITLKYPETGRRVRQRLELVFADAEFHKLLIGNPGRAIREKVRETCGGRKTESYRTLAYQEVPAFVVRLRAVQGISARALEFALLSAARTSEVRGARWCEIDFDSRTWTVPAERMKARQIHIVHLSDRAIEILERQRGISTRYVFPTVRAEDGPLSNMAMLECLRRLGVGQEATVHGLCRASFATWAYEAAGAREEIVEACLAHKEVDRVKAAYDRSQHHAARRGLLQAWCDFVNGKAQASNVIEGDFRAPREPAGFPDRHAATARD